MDLRFRSQNEDDKRPENVEGTWSGKLIEINIESGQNDQKMAFVYCKSDIMSAELHHSFSTEKESEKVISWTKNIVDWNPCISSFIIFQLP